MSFSEGSGARWRTSSRHGFSACDGIDVVTGAMLDVLELTCVNALDEENRSVATHNLLGNGENVQLSIEK
jgi:hypothetical protein